MELTDRAEALWASYETEVRTRLGDQGDVDVDDVLAGIREHVEAELSQRGTERVTGEDLAEVLDRLGGPSEWTGAAGPPPAPDSSAGTARPRWPEWVALGLTLAGLVLILLGFWWSWAPGWGLLVVGVVVARVSLDDHDLEAGPSGSGPTRRLARLVWGAAALAALAALVLAPAVLTWVAAQIGGPLEQRLPGQPGVPGSSGAPGYWRMPVVIGASATAIWWLVLAGLAARFGDAARRVLGPAHSLIPAAAPRALMLGAAVVILSSLIAGVLV